MSSLVRGAATYLAAPIVVLVLWQAISMMVASPSVPTSTDAVEGMVDALGNPRFRSSLLSTLRLLGLSFLLAAVIGILAGALAGGSSLARRVLGPVLHLVNATPKIVFFPVFILALGLGDSAKLSFAVFHGVFIAAIVMMEATEGLDPRYRKVISAYRLRAVQATRLIVLPALLPYVVTALRLCLAFTFIGLILAELLTGTGGIGGEILRLMRLAEVERITGIVLLVMVIAVVPVMLLRAVEVRIRSRYAPNP